MGDQLSDRGHQLRMRFLVDLNMSPRTVALLNDLGHDAIAGKEVMPPRSPDSEIVALAIHRTIA